MDVEAWGHVVVVFADVFDAGSIEHFSGLSEEVMDEVVVVLGVVDGGDELGDTVGVFFVFAQEYLVPFDRDHLALHAHSDTPGTGFTERLF